MSDLANKLRPQLAIQGLIERTKPENALDLAFRSYHVRVQNLGPETIERCKINVSYTRERSQEQIEFLGINFHAVRNKQYDQVQKKRQEMIFALYPGECKDIWIASLAETSKSAGIMIRSGFEGSSGNVGRETSYLIAVAVFGGPRPLQASYSMFVEDSGKLSVRPAGEINPA